MSAEERLIRYCRIDTQSDPANEDETPSTQKQFDLAKVLKEELLELGLEDVELDEHCYVYGKLPSNLDHEVPTIGFIAHMDTAPDFSGANVNPRVIECFDGEDIVLNEEKTISMEAFPHMKSLKGKRLIVTDGNSLLGADDKAGITAIMEALDWMVKHPEFKHGTVMVGFTPDEEIGNGPKYFDVEKFNAKFAYTMDGGSVDGITWETFNAAEAVVQVKGISIHPGSAKDKMLNAAGAAARFACALPEHRTPEHTENREGYIHLGGMTGNVEEAQLHYILRDHDASKLEESKVLMQKTADYLNEYYGHDAITIAFRDGYRNMADAFVNAPEAIELARKAVKALGYEPVEEPARGGTDGAVLSFRGLPCPNLGNGCGNCHGPFEYCVVEELEKSSELILKVIEMNAEGE